MPHLTWRGYSGSTGCIIVGITELQDLLLGHFIHICLVFVNKPKASLQSFKHGSDSALKS